MIKTSKENQDHIDNDEKIRESGQAEIDSIYLMSIIGEIEGHENLSNSSKTTKYEHILPKLAEIEQDCKIKGVLILINTIGGDVSCGLALAEMIASLSKPTVSLLETAILLECRLQLLQIIPILYQPQQ